MGQPGSTRFVDFGASQASLLDLMQQGKLTPVLDKTYGLADVNEAFRQLEDRLVFGKVVVKP